MKLYFHYWKDKVKKIANKFGCNLTCYQHSFKKILICCAIRISGNVLEFCQQSFIKKNFLLGFCTASLKNYKNKGTDRSFCVMEHIRFRQCSEVANIVQDSRLVLLYYLLHPFLNPLKIHSQSGNWVWYQLIRQTKLNWFPHWNCQNLF